MTIKIRPAILLISLGLVVALNIVAWAIFQAIMGGITGEMLTAVVAFGGMIATGLVASIAKLVESEEQSK